MKNCNTFCHQQQFRRLGCIILVDYPILYTEKVEENKTLEKDCKWLSRNAWYSTEYYFSFKITKEVCPLYPIHDGTTALKSAELSWAGFSKTMSVVIEPSMFHFFSVVNITFNYSIYAVEPNLILLFHDVIASMACVIFSSLLSFRDPST